MRHTEIKVEILSWAADMLMKNGHEKEADDVSWDLLVVILCETFEPGVYAS